jgi:hypothetical protein
MIRLKLYLMIGLPTETEADIDECSKFVSELASIVPISLGIAPFCSKRNTPLDRHPFAGINVVDDRLDRLRRGLKGRAEVRSTSAKWAWVEWVLAQGGAAAGIAAVQAARAGGSFAAYKRAFRDLEGAPRKPRSSAPDPLLPCLQPRAKPRPAASARAEPGCARGVSRVCRARPSRLQLRVGGTRRRDAAPVQRDVFVASNIHGRRQDGSAFESPT